MSEEVLVSTDDGIMVVTINRPEAKNAANRAVAQGVAAAMEQLDGDKDIRVAIITGAGGTFCSGMDLKGFVSGETPVVKGRGFAGLTEAPPQKPLIAAVEGYALAGGFEIVLACDLVIAADNSKFGIPEAKRGLVAGAGGLIRLPRQVPPRLAMELALTGEFVTSQRVYEMGLINKVVPAGSALDEAKALAKTICANGPLAVAISKKIIVESEDWSRDEMWAKQQDLMAPIFGSKDAIEGATAFAEKRAPKWTGE